MSEPNRRTVLRRAQEAHGETVRQIQALEGERSVLPLDGLEEDESELSYRTSVLRGVPEVWETYEGNSSGSYHPNTNGWTVT